MSTSVRASAALVTMTIAVLGGLTVPGAAHAEASPTPAATTPAGTTPAPGKTTPAVEKTPSATPSTKPATATANPTQTAKPPEKNAAGTTTPDSTGESAAELAAYWTPERMAAAVPDDPRALGPGSSATGASAPHQALAPALTPPVGTKDGEFFGGMAMVGRFKWTKGGTAHYCSGSVVASPGHNIAVTAGHCGIGMLGATNAVFIPQYQDGVEISKQPQGVYPFTASKAGVFLDPRYTENSKLQNSDLDFAFVRLGAGLYGNTVGKQVQDVTGGLTLTDTPSYTNAQVLIVGYPNNDTKHRAIRCTVPTDKLPSFNQMRMYCSGYYGGVSGGPWILNYDEANRTGELIGNVGGYFGGGDNNNDDWVTYSPMYDKYNHETRDLYDDAVANRQPSRPSTYSTPPQALQDSPLPDAITWRDDSKLIASGNFIGDANDDLLVVWIDGEVDIYPGDGKGHFGAEIRILNPNTEWKDATVITGGDFGGGDQSDLLVRWVDGEVDNYPDVGNNGLADSNGTRLADPGSIWKDAMQLVGGRFTDDTPYLTDLEVRWTDGEVSLYHHVGDTFGTETQLMPPNNTWTGAAGLTGGNFSGIPLQDTMVRWTDGSLDTIGGPSPELGLGPAFRLEQPGSVWKDETLMTTGNFVTGGLHNDVVVRWVDGEVDLYPDTTITLLGQEERLVSP